MLLKFVYNCIFKSLYSSYFYIIQSVSSACTKYIKRPNPRCISLFHLINLGSPRILLPSTISSIIHIPRRIVLIPNSSRLRVSIESPTSTKPYLRLLATTISTPPSTYHNSQSTCLHTIHTDTAPQAPVRGQALPTESPLQIR